MPAFRSTPRGERASNCRDAFRPDGIFRPWRSRRVKGAASDYFILDAAGAEPRAESRRRPIFEHGEHPPFDAPCPPWHPPTFGRQRWCARQVLVVRRIGGADGVAGGSWLRSDG